MDTGQAALAAAIRERRLALNAATQAQMAARAGISEGTWNNAENGKPLSVRNMVKISTALGWTADSAQRILDGEEPELAPEVTTGEPSTELDPLRLADLERRMSRIEAMIERLLAGSTSNHPGPLPG